MEIVAIELPPALRRRNITNSKETPSTHANKRVGAGGGAEPPLCRRSQTLFFIIIFLLRNKNHKPGVIFCSVRERVFCMCERESVILECKWGGQASHRWFRRSSRSPSRRSQSRTETSPQSLDRPSRRGEHHAPPGSPTELCAEDKWTKVSKNKSLVFFLIKWPSYFTFAVKGLRKLPALVPDHLQHYAFWLWVGVPRQRGFRLEGCADRSICCQRDICRPHAWNICSPCSCKKKYGKSDEKNHTSPRKWIKLHWSQKL